MKRFRLAAACFGLLLFASSALAQVDAYQAWEDARVIRRVATVAGKSIPRDLLQKIAGETVDTLRGKQPGGAYLFAHYQRVETSVKQESFSVKERKGEEPPTSFEHRGTIAYRVILEVASRRYLVARNRGVHIESVSVDYTNEAGAKKVEEFKLAMNLAPGEKTTLDLKEIAFNPVAHVVGWTEKEAGGSGSIDVIFSEPKLVDDAQSPFAESVQLAQELAAATGKSDIAEIRRLCDALTTAIERAAPGTARSREDLSPSTVATVSVTPAGSTGGAAAPAGLYRELQSIEDLLTGSEAERRDGMDKLHQLIRAMRP